MRSRVPRNGRRQYKENRYRENNRPRSHKFPLTFPRAGEKRTIDRLIVVVIGLLIVSFIAHRIDFGDSEVTTSKGVDISVQLRGEYDRQRRGDYSCQNIDYTDEPALDDLSFAIFSYYRARCFYQVGKRAEGQAIIRKALSLSSLSDSSILLDLEVALQEGNMATGDTATGDRGSGTGQDGFQVLAELETKAHLFHRMDLMSEVRLIRASLAAKTGEYQSAETTLYDLRVGAGSDGLGKRAREVMYTFLSPDMLLAKRTAGPILREIDALMEEGSFGDALNLANKAIETIGPDNAARWSFRLFRGRALIKVGNQNEGLSELRAVGQANEEGVSDEALYYLGLFYWNEDKHEEAIACFSSLISRFSSSSRAEIARYYLGRALDEIDKQEPLQSVVEVVASGAGYSPLIKYKAAKMLAWSFYRKGKYSDALRWFQKANAFSQELASSLTGIDGDHITPMSALTFRSHALYWMGRAQEELGDSEGAKAAYRELIGLQPNGYYGARLRNRGVELGIKVPVSPVCTSLKNSSVSDLVKRNDALTNSPSSSSLEEGMGDIFSSSPLKTLSTTQSVNLAPLIAREVEAVIVNRFPIALTPIRSYDWTIDQWQTYFSSSSGSLAILLYKDLAHGAAPVYLPLWEKAELLTRESLYWDDGRHCLGNFELDSFLSLLGKEQRKMLLDGALFDVNKANSDSRVADGNAKQTAVLPLVLAISRTESYLDPWVVSNRQAKGLMQLIDATAISEGVEPADLFKPARNIEAGARHIVSLIRKYDGNEVSAIAAYNAGESAVKRWRDRYPTLSDEAWIEHIGFAETQDYVQKVLRAKWKYESATLPPS